MQEFPKTFPASSENAKLQYRKVEAQDTSHKRPPAYVLEPGGRAAVPSGRVFVRLAPGLRFADQAEAFRTAGYEIAEAVSYAPNAGWLRAADGSIASALKELHSLAALPGVENVEPQMLSEAVRK